MKSCFLALTLVMASLELDQRASHAEDAAPAHSAAAEVSVRPGVNADYFKPDALRKFTGVLETESREVVRARATILAALRLEQGNRVADLGAGTGLFTLELARAVGAKGRVYAVDIVPSFLARIGQRARHAKLRQVQTVLGQERSPGLPRASVDLAFMCDVYHHLEYPRAYLQAVRAALRPGGELVVIDFKRIPGQSKPAILKHVRAGEDEVRAEIEAAGFEFVGAEPNLLEENYLLRFRARASLERPPLKE
ncbi:MAG: methyltransferase domain-containing protein [Myxococcales bacterium]